MVMIAAFFFALLTLAAPSTAAGILEEKLTLQASFPDPDGARTIDLDTLVFRPGGGGRHPLAVISHGAPRDPKVRPDMSPRSYWAQAREFARRGWVTVVVMRRGYGASGGAFVEGPGPCGSPDYVRSGVTSAQDIRSAIQAMAQKPYVDATRVLAIGSSAGGLATIALTANPPPGLVAAINFAGGRGSVRPNEVCQKAALAKAFGTFGRTSSVPTLWIYAENDSFFPPAMAREFVGAFTRAGGDAEFVAAPAFGTEGHNLFSQTGIPVWTRHADAFLDRLDLTLRDRLIALPSEGPVAYPLGLSASGREAFGRYLDSAPDKAFAMSPRGAYGWSGGRPSASVALTDAVATCQKHTEEACVVVGTDQEPARQARPPTHAQAQASPPPNLGAKGREAFATYLDSPPNKAFAVSPKGAFGWRTGLSSPAAATAAAIETCEMHTREACHVVMINNQPAPQGW